MGTYATNADVTRNIPARPIDSTSSPSTTDIDAWITQAEAMLTGALAGGGVSVPITDTGGIQIMRIWTVLFAEGHTRMALAASAADVGNDDGKDMVEAFGEVVSKIQADPGFYEAMLKQGTTSDSARRLRTYVTDNADGLTVADGDFSPVFTRNEVF